MQVLESWDVSMNMVPLLICRTARFDIIVRLDHDLVACKGRIGRVLIGYRRRRVLHVAQYRWSGMADQFWSYTLAYHKYFHFYFNFIITHPSKHSYFNYANF